MKAKDSSDIKERETSRLSACLLLFKSHHFASIQFQLSLPRQKDLFRLWETDDPKKVTDPANAPLLYEAKSELERNKDMAEKIQLRSYYAMMLALTLVENPEYFGDRELVESCQSIENLTLDLSRDELNAIVVQHYKRLDIPLNQFDFNPNFRIKLEIEWVPGIGFFYIFKNTDF